MLYFLKNLLRAQLIKPIIACNQSSVNNKKIEYNKILKFGNKNKNLIFYVIKKNFTPSGFFSNLFFVLDHLNYAIKKKYIPFVDMENFPNPYNEKKKIRNTKNSWEYYFYNLSNYKDIYSSSNVIFSDNFRINRDFFPPKSNMKKVFKKHIKILPEHLTRYNKIKSLIFNKKEKILGISISGGLQKIVRGHWFPLDAWEMLEISKYIFIKEKCTKIFLATRDLDYYDKFYDHYKEKFIHISLPRSKSFFLGSHNTHFEDYCRKNHRYKLGRETLIDGLLLSNVSVLLCDKSNISSFAVMNSKKKIKYQIHSEYNSNNIFLSRWLWYLKIYFPFVFGKIKYKIVKIN